MSDFTLLTREQCDSNRKLDILKKRGIKAEITDFSILLGGYDIDGDDSLADRASVYWTKSKEDDEIGNDVYVVVGSVINSECVADRTAGIRPVLPFSSLNSIPVNNELSKKRAEDGIFEVEYGYYPQKAVSKDMQLELEQEFKRGKLLKTGKGYTVNSKEYDFDDSDYDGENFEPKKYDEYKYNGKRYVRVEANFGFEEIGRIEILLSNGKKYKVGDNVWVEVLPVKWLVDEKAKIMLTEKAICAGIRFNHTRVKDFDKTLMKSFMDEYLSKDLKQSREKIDLVENQVELTRTRKSRLERLNPDETEVSERTKMTDTEIIHNWIESGESVLLRGPSGIGKTERIKSLYPDLIYLKLTNNMFPEKVVGSTNLQTGESIPPDFAKIAIMEGATEEEKKLIEENIQNIYKIADTIYERSKESEEKVVILLDELLNVKPAVQSLVYTLVLNRMVEIGKGLKLPENVVIVATGNQKKYSSVAEDLAEPLQKRFDHILDMEPKVGEWITEYAIPHKIHPAVIGYILSKYDSTGKSEDIDDIGYFYEEPEVGEKHLDSNGCKGKTNDPRGWTAISNILYNFERNLRAGKYKGKDVEDIIQRSIESKLRIEWASEFYDFYNLPTLTPEEVVKGIGKGYTQADLPRDINERFAYMTALITADESQVEACREFIRKYCDPEYLEVYDIYWAGNDERKMERISELQEMAIPLHKAEETKEYAEEGAKVYSILGQKYNRFLETEKNKGEKENERGKM